MIQIDSVECISNITETPNYNSNNINDNHYLNRFVLFSIQSRHELNAVVLFEIIFEGGYAFGLVLISCELGQQMTDAFESCNTVLCELEWYLFPVGIRKMLPPILLIAQVPVRLECFGSNACTRESFKKVCIVWL